MADKARPGDGRWRVTPDHGAGGLIKGTEKAMELASEHMLRDAPKLTRFVAKRFPGGAPGLIYDAATLATAKDKWRKGAGIVGGGMGATVGGALGAVGGPPGAVVGAAVGSALGESAAEALYDNRLKIADWMKVRAATLADDLSDGVEHYAPVNRIRRAYGRR